MTQVRQMTSQGKIVIVIAIIAIAGAVFGLANQHQTEADCSKAERYNQSAQKCINKTGQEYINEINKIETEEQNAQTEADRRSGKSCIPADEAKNYIGVNGCVSMFVQDYYIAEYGWAWLNSGGTQSDFSVAALGKGILTRNDAEYYLGKYIGVRGEIVLYEGAPEIKITNKDAIFSVTTQEEMIQRMQDVNKKFSEYTRQCEWKTNAYGIKTYQCPETESDRQKKCFEEGVEKAKNRSQKDQVYDKCKNP